MGFRRTVTALAVLTVGTGVAGGAIATAAAEPPDGPILIAQGGMEADLAQGQPSDDGTKVAHLTAGGDGLPSSISLTDVASDKTKYVYTSQHRGNSVDFDLSGDARYIAAHVDYEDTRDVLFVRNTSTLSVHTLSGFSHASQPELSDNGRTLVFVGQLSGQSVRAVYVKNLSTGKLTRVSSHGATDPVISGDGTRVAYKQYSRIYMKPSTGGEATPVDVRPNGYWGTVGKTKPVAFSDNGRYLAFTKSSTELAPGTDACDDNATGCAFRRNLTESKTTVGSVLPDGTITAVEPGGADLSGDGKVLAFSAVAGADGTQVFVRTLGTATTRMASVNAAGETADSPAFAPSLSNDGALVTFLSAAENFVDEENLYGLDWLWLARGK